ncbi:MAG: hypothetical protein U5K33_05170 [Halofilum sp. (in: g-proteobacteria)]|nr:hypothetical protein [Halofilum sp. (in: g-proteobacteria)]
MATEHRNFTPSVAASIPVEQTRVNPIRRRSCRYHRHAIDKVAIVIARLLSGIAGLSWPSSWLTVTWKSPAAIPSGTKSASRRSPLLSSAVGSIPSDQRIANRSGICDQACIRRLIQLISRARAEWPTTGLALYVQYADIAYIAPRIADNIRARR